MKKLLILVVVLIGFLTISCKKELEPIVNITNIDSVEITNLYLKADVDTMGFGTFFHFSVNTWDTTFTTIEQLNRLTFDFSNGLLNIVTLSDTSNNGITLCINTEKSELNEVTIGTYRNVHMMWKDDEKLTLLNCDIWITLDMIVDSKDVNTKIILGTFRGKDNSKLIIKNGTFRVKIKE